MPVTVACRARRAQRWTHHLGVRGAQILRALGLSGDDLSLSLVDDAEMRTLNATYRHRDRATDVLAFALTENVAPGAPLTVATTNAPRNGRGRPTRGRVLGDVVISIDTATEQARDDGVDVATRLDALLIHGVLHLVGYDHERSPAEERRMQRKEREITAALPVVSTAQNAGAARGARR